ATVSSQYATALALLSATGAEFELDLGKGPLASGPYFEMTLALLGEAGVAIDRGETSLRFGPTAALHQPCILNPETDASSAAVWAMAELVGVEAHVARPPTTGRQPDARAAYFAHELANAHRTGLEGLVIELDESPDLAPVLVAVATQIDPRVDIVGAAHLRHKESDRIGDLAQAFARIGILVEPREDGLHIPRGRQEATADALFPTHGDHRLAMAALLASAQTSSLRIEAPMVVAKSYPDFWHHARRLGWSVTPT
ncbi:MAG: hypothetical protein ACNA8W_24125, partial [Bradymonadaceae bacterium]